MPLLDVNQSLRIPGRLVIGPTNLATAFPHGGTSLGLVQNIIFRPNIQTQDVTGEEFGGEVIESVISGQSALLAVVLRGWDDEMVNNLFPETAIGGSTGDRIIRKTSTTRSGRLGSAQAFKLLFSPRDATNHPGLIIYNAMPLIEETAEIAFSTEREHGMPAIFRGIQDSAGKIWEMAKLADMTL